MTITQLRSGSKGVIVNAAVRSAAADARMAIHGIVGEGERAKETGCGCQLLTFA
jgi:hypothetical protein